MFGDVYQQSAVALRPVYLCKIPVPAINILDAESPRLRRQMMK